MNRNEILIAAGGFVLAASSAFAGAGTSIRADVPFAFYAGKLLFPPGSYVLTVNDPEEPGLLNIREENGRERELLVTVPENRRQGAARGSKLVFERFGKDNFLSEVWVTGRDEGRAVPKSVIDRERAVLLRQTGASIPVEGHSNGN
jgi:hypothetical protein